MGFFRLRRSIKILPGVRWNIGKKSSSLSFGGKGFRYTVGTNGSRTTVGIPGTGISYTTAAARKRGSSRPPALPSHATSGQSGGVLTRVILIAVGLLIFGGWIGSLRQPPTPSPVATVPVPSTASRPMEMRSPAVPAPSAAVTASATPRLVKTVAASPSPAPVNPAPLVDMADLASHPNQWPNPIKLTQPVVFPAMLNGRIIGYAKAPAGSMVDLVKVNRDTLDVEFQGGRVSVRSDVTDLAARILAIRARAAYLAELRAAATPAPVPEYTSTNSAPTPFTSSGESSSYFGGGSVHVSGYTRRDGTHVSSYSRRR